jgi:hypothetical protein
MDRSTLITTVHKRLSDSATEAGLSAEEASYGAWVDYALRTLHLAAVTSAVGQQLNRLIDYTEAAALTEIRGYYAVRSDIELGPRREKFSQILKAIDLRLAQLGLGPVYTVTDFQAEWNEYAVSSGDRSTYPINWFQIGSDEPTYG